MRRLLIVCACAAQPACAATVAGVVYIDRNGDGVRQDDEPGVPGATVMLDHGTATGKSGPDGWFSLEAAAGAASVWVRTPAGFRPGPVWARLDGRAELALSPLSPEADRAPVTFVVASDTHIVTPTPGDPWDNGDLADAIDQAIALPEPPRFFTIVGDVTQANRPDEFARVEEALRDVAVPWIPVAGNHDWYDGGRAWRERWGPDNYSFDVGDLHVIVWDTNLGEDVQLDFFRADLADVPAATTVVALGHASPDDDVADELAALGVDYMFTGHWHANRRVERDGLVEWGTQTLIMGTIDQSPAGYRIVTFAGGPPIVEHRARLVEPHVSIAAPHRGSCTPPGAPLDVLASAALDAGTPAVTAHIDCGPAIPLVARGGWSFGARLPGLPPGTHRLTVTAESPAGRRLSREIAFEVCERNLGTPAAGDWPQLGGGPAHTNAAARPIAPPLQQAWATPIGANVLLGSPIVAAGTVVVSVWDLGAGDRGGLVALDLATGAERWRYTTPYQARNAPAIDGDTVVVALGNGEVHAVALADGRRRWVHDAADGVDSLAASLWAAPTIADGLVYVAVQGRMSALDLMTGDVVWSRDAFRSYPWLGSLAAVTVADGTAVVNTGREDGTRALSAMSGGTVWDLRGPSSIAINATPIAEDGVLYLANAAGVVTAVDLATGDPAWWHSVTPGAHEWSYAVTATPSLAGGRLFVPTQYGEIVALDAATGARLWRYETLGGPLQFAHYRSAEAGFAASSVATGDVLWVPRPDGILAALDPADGRELWRTRLGAPIVSAPAPAGDHLVVATFDGVIRALVPAPDAVPPLVEACEPPGSDVLTPAGCCGASGGTSAVALGVPLVLAWRGRRRRRATS